MEDALKERLGNYSLVNKENPQFKFTCAACGQCCHNRVDGQTIIVSPYDIFRIVKEAAPEDPKTFIEKYFGFYVGNSSGLLIAHLATKDLYGGDNICVFLKKKESGYKCSVHSHKPAACRLFPLGRIVEESMKGPEKEPVVQYVLQEDIGCNKHIPVDQRDLHTLEEWIPDLAETEKAFINFTKFTHEAYKIINLHALAESEKIGNRSKNILYTLMHALLYSLYEYDKPFDEQFKTNTATLLKGFETFVNEFKKIDYSIVPKRRS